MQHMTNMKKRILIFVVLIIAVLAVVLWVYTSQVISSPSVISDMNAPVDYKQNEIVYDYYDVTDNSTKQERIPLDSDSSLKSGLELVAQNLFGKTLEETPMNPNSVTLQNGKLVIDFKSDIINANLGASGENSMLNALSELYLNNLDQVQAIYFTIEGSDFITSHTVIYSDEAYRSK